MIFWMSKMEIFKISYKMTYSLCYKTKINQALIQSSNKYKIFSTKLNQLNQASSNIYAPLIYITSWSMPSSNQCSILTKISILFHSLTPSHAMSSISWMPWATLCLPTSAEHYPHHWINTLVLLLTKSRRKLLKFIAIVINSFSLVCISILAKLWELDIKISLRIWVVLNLR